MTTEEEANETCELTGTELGLVTGGSFTGGVRAAVMWANTAAVLVYAGAYSVTAAAEYHPDPWG
jgi:hypothetical protein